MELTPGVFRTTLHSSSVSVSPSTVIMPETTSNKLSFWMAAIFLAGEMAGSGVLALPNAVTDAGWIGLLLIVLCCVNSAYSGTRLGLCWIIIEERFPEYLADTRDPYPTIAFRAFGVKMKRLVSLCIVVTLFGVSTVFLLLFTQFLQSLCHSFLPMSYCYWIILGGVVLIPFTWFGSPKDFWFVAVFALVSTAIACLMIFTLTMLEIKNFPDPPKHTSPDFQGFAFAFGTILFAFGGAAVFPTVQNDMKDRKQFPKSVLLTFTILLLLYLPVAAGGYFVFGDRVKANIVLNLSSGAVDTAVQILLAIHLFFAFIIAFNPICQQLEEIFKIPTGFNWKRCVFRSACVIFSISVGLAIPRFGNILSLIGGSSVTMLTFIFPPLFYMRLCDQKQIEWPERKIALHVRVYLWELVLIGFLGGISATWSALSTMFSSTTFITPCFINPQSHCFVDLNANC